VHQICTFDTYVSIVYGTINHYKKISLMALEFPELFDRSKMLSIYLQSKSSKFIVSLKENYMTYLKKYEENNIKFKLIDALEQSSSTNFTNYIIPELKEMLEDDVGSRISEVITQNMYLKRKFPHLDQRGEDLNLSRVGPFMPINPLKAHKANPTYNLPKEIKLNKHRFSKGRIQLHRKYCTVERFRGNENVETTIILNMLNI
jgi:hypothetical protein